MISLYMSCSIYWCLLNVAVSNRRNTYESFFIRGQVQFVDNRLIYVYHSTERTQ
jgi:hypothetical protein